uniref:BLVR domain-containing protein n=1 Tax=Panagrellus redivivus TaxID=6233 RepID=A0A7E4ZQD5_PANRE
MSRDNAKAPKRPRAASNDDRNPCDGKDVPEKKPRQDVSPLLENAPDDNPPPALISDNEETRDKTPVDDTEP